MKKGFPSLGKKPKIYQTETAYDLNDSIIKLSCETPHKLEEKLDKEVSRLDAQLDSYEISTLNTNKDFTPYKFYLQGIAQVLKKKQPIISAKLLRGITGWEKTMSSFTKQTRKLSKYSIKVEKTVKNSAIQTEIQVNKEQVLHKADISNFLNLQKSVKKIKISRLTSKLKDIYEKLQILDIDVPSRSNTPDMPEYELDELIRFSPQFRLKSKKALDEAKVMNKLLKGKLTVDKEVQVSVLNEGGNTISSGYIDAEISLVRKNRELELALKENKTLVERIKKLSEGNIKKSEPKMKTVIDEETKKIMNSQDFNSKTFEILKNKLEILNAKYIKQQKKLNFLDSMLFNSKVLWKTAEDRLKQISSAWEIQTGSSFNFKAVNIKKIADELKISKESDMLLLQTIEKQLNSLLNQPESKNLEESHENSEKTLKFEQIRENTKKNSAKIKKKVLDHDIEPHTKKKPSQKERKEGQENLKSSKISRKVKIEENSKVEITSSSEESQVNHKAEKILKKKILEHSESKAVKDLINYTESSDNPSNQKPISLKPQKKKSKFGSLDYRLIDQEPSPDLRKVEISKTQNLKKNKKFVIPEGLATNSKPETPAYDNYSKLRANQKYFSGFPKALDALNTSNYEEVLLKSLPMEQAKALKKFIDSLIMKTPGKIRYSADETLENEEKKLNYSINLDRNEKKYYIDEKMRKLMENDERIFEFLESEEKEKPKEMLRKVFNTDELRNLPPTAKTKINQLIIGHDLNCEDICIHLKRVMALKFKILGIKYPLKTQLLKFELK